MVVAKKWFQQLTSLGSGLTFTPIAGGNYRLSIYLSVNTNLSATGHVYPSASWTDNYRLIGNDTFVPSRVALPYNSASSMCWMADVWVAPGTVIFLGTAGDPIPSGSTLDEYYLIEELSAPQL